MGAPLSEAQRRQVAGVPGVTVHESGYRLEWMSNPWDDVSRAGDWLLALEARLAPDMMNLVAQVQRASDTSKLSGQRLSGVTSPGMPDTETTFAELQKRIADIKE